MNALPLPSRLRYWRSLLNREHLKNPLLLAGHADELRTALRDVIHELGNSQETIQKLERKNQHVHNELTRIKQDYASVIADAHRNKQEKIS